MPDHKERFMLWQKSMPAVLKAEPSLNFNDVANKYEITGAAILNVVYYAALKAIAANNNCILQKDVLEGIRRELRKEEKTMQ